MELQRFVSQSLVAIMEGIKDAQTELAGKSHGRICPQLSHAITEGGNKVIVGLSTEKRPIALVEYDVAVEVTRVAGLDKIEVKLAVLSGSRERDGRDDKDAARIKFAVPVSYPEIAGDPASSFHLQPGVQVQ